MKTSGTENYTTVTISCGNCNNTFESRSTHQGDIAVEVCSNCHPVYTGQQRATVSSSQVDKFNDRFSPK